LRTLASFIVTTLDGFYEGLNQEFDWPNVDDEFNAFAVAQLDAADTLVFGRVTYEFMSAYWPSPDAQKDDPAVASRMNGMPKVVISTTLDTPTWSGSRVVKGDLAEGMGALKAEPGRDLLVLGSPSLTTSLAQVGLLDELRIMVNPVILGQGKSLFNRADRRVGLNLLAVRRFTSGNVLLTYAPGGLRARSVAAVLPDHPRCPHVQAALRQAVLDDGRNSGASGPSSWSGTARSSIEPQVWPRKPSAAYRTDTAGEPLVLSEDVPSAALACGKGQLLIDE